MVLLCHQAQTRNLIYVSMRAYFYQQSPRNKNRDEVNLMAQQSSFNIFTFFLTLEVQPASETSSFAELKIMEALGNYQLYLSVLEILLITSRSEEKSSMARHSSLTAPVDTNWGKTSSSPATLRKAPVSWNKAWLVCSGMREPSTRCKEK